MSTNRFHRLCEPARLCPCPPRHRSEQPSVHIRRASVSHRSSTREQASAFTCIDRELPVSTIVRPSSRSSTFARELPCFRPSHRPLTERPPRHSTSPAIVQANTPTPLPEPSARCVPASSSTSEWAPPFRLPPSSASSSTNPPPQACPRIFMATSTATAPSSLVTPSALPHVNPSSSGLHRSRARHPIIAGH